MKKLFFLPLAALVFAACSEATAPDTNADLSPSYAKGGNPGKPGGGGGGGGGGDVAGLLTNLSFDFEGDISAAGALGIGAFVTEDQDDPTDASAAAMAVAGELPVQSTYTAGGSGFFGRFPTVGTQAVLNLGTPGSRYLLEFDLYVIGSWDGKGKQAQQGSFLANIFTVAYRCGPNTADVSNIFSTTFSNQLTVQQDYPLPVSSGGGAKAGTGAFAIDALGYKQRPDLSHTPQFRSFGDAIYKFSFTNANPCQPGQQLSFIFKSSNPLEQNVKDESWAIDNVVIKTDA